MILLVAVDNGLMVAAVVAVGWVRLTAGLALAGLIAAGVASMLSPRPHAPAAAQPEPGKRRPTARVDWAALNRQAPARTGRPR